jgi:hypothetical protein
VQTRSLRPGGNPSACWWKGAGSILLGDNQDRHCVAPPAVNCASPWRASARRLGSLGPACEREPQHVGFGRAVEILVIGGREDVNAPDLGGRGRSVRLAEPMGWSDTRRSSRQ